ISSVYRGKQIKNSDIIQLDYFKKNKIESNIEQVRVEFDGDPQGYLPCTIEMAEDNLELIIGKNNE
ncbi:diacylglycerol kinase, partial [Candidatus Dependentiae bacterium]|nr:diacylglycerol kinase [Candidatus Dependentiae bacterium]